MTDPGINSEIGCFVLFFINPSWIRRVQELESPSEDSLIPEFQEDCWTSVEVFSPRNTVLFLQTVEFRGRGVSGGHWEPAAVSFIQHKLIWRPSGKFWVLPECLTCASLPTAVICIINHQENTEPISSPPFELDAKLMSYQKSCAASLGSVFDRPAGAAVQRRVWSIHASDFTSTLTETSAVCWQKAHCGLKE